MIKYLKKTHKRMKKLNSYNIFDFYNIQYRIMGFFYISAPYLEKSRQATHREITDVVLKKSIADGKEIFIDRKKFKLANLDTLMMVNDKLLKLEGNIESFLKKIDKQYLDLQDKPSHEWYIKSADKQYTIPKYLYNFNWNDSKYPRSYPLLRIEEIIEAKVSQFESELRTRVNAYNETKTLLSQNTLKEGSYAVRDLTDLLVQPNVDPRDFVYTKFITTLIAIVPLSQCADFQRDHGMISDYVIPGSAKRLNIPQKDNLTIWKINVFNERTQEQQLKRQQQAHDQQEQHKMNEDPKKKGLQQLAEKKRNQTTVQEFIEKAKQKMKITIKEFKFQSGFADERKKKKKDLEAKLATQNKAVSDICLAYFAETYELYAHAKILRLIVETNMRFGSDPTVIYIIETVPGKQKNVQTLLVDIFGDKQTQGLYGTKDQIDDGQDFFPYIYIPMLTLT